MATLRRTVAAASRTGVVQPLPSSQTSRALKPSQETSTRLQRRPWLHVLYWLRSALAQWPLAWAFAIPLVVFWLQRDIGLGLLDEGFVWYGAQRVLQGDVPLRDFQAYDIGRYGWYAAWMWLWGSDGIIPLRAASAVLAGCTVAIVTRLLQRQQQRQGLESGPALALAAATFALWMVPYYKVADSFAAVLLLAGLVGLVRRASARNWLRYGVCLGVAGTIGINHAFYGVLAAVLFVAWARWHGLVVLRARKLAHAVAGAAVGYAPVLACHLWVPGFTAAFVDTIRILFESGTTNLGRAFDSFFTAWSAPGLPATTTLREFTLSAVLLVLAPAFGLVCAWYILRRQQRGPHVLPALHALPAHAAPDASSVPHDAAVRSDPAFVAAVIASAAYAHYAISRADLAHLSVSVLPLLAAAWTFPWRSPSASLTPAFASSSTPGVTPSFTPSFTPTLTPLWRFPPPVQSLFLLLIFVISGVLAAPAHSLYQRMRSVPLEPVSIAGEVLRLGPTDARDVRFLQALHATQQAQPQRAMYVAPYWPGAYAVLRTRAPVWEIYAIFPATAARQQRELQRLQQAGVSAAVLQGWHMDERPELGFAQTHPLIAAYLAKCMVETTSPQLDWQAPSGVQVYLQGPATGQATCSQPAASPLQSPSAWPPSSPSPSPSPSLSAPP